MKFEEHGGWIVSTPIYMGSTDDVWKAQKCAHQEYREGTRRVDQGMLIVQELCTGCVASRVKYRPATPEEAKENG